MFKELVEHYLHKAVSGSTVTEENGLFYGITAYQLETRVLSELFIILATDVL